MGKSFSPEQREVWAQRIQSQQASGLPVTRWCQEQGIIPHVFYYWKSRLHPKKIERSSFVEVTSDKKCILRMESSDFLLTIESSTLKQALQALRELGC